MAVQNKAVPVTFKRKAHQKMDPHTVSNQPWELDFIVHRFSKLGINISRDTIRNIKKDKSIGKSRPKIYRRINEMFKKK